MPNSPLKDKDSDSSLSQLPVIMSTEELARALGISPSALMQDRHQRSDCIPYIKIGRRVRYLRDDVCRYMASHRLGGQGSASSS